MLNPNTMLIEPTYHGNQRDKLPVYDAGSESGNATLNYGIPMRELMITNDDPINSLTLTVNGDSGYSINFTLQPLDILDERYYPFTQVVVIATGNWRYEVRSGVIT